MGSRSSGSKYFLAGVVVVMLLLAAGCRAPEEEGDWVAVIQARTESPYISTFKELNLGPIFDFHMKLPKADESWVDIWVEGFSGGKPLEPDPLISLSYGHSPRGVSEGPMGLAIVNGPENKKSMILYAPGVTSSLLEIDHRFSDQTASAWGSALGEEELRLKPGEIKTLAFYTQTQSRNISTIDPENEQQMKSILESGDTLLLMKIKVVNKRRP